MAATAQPTEAIFWMGRPIEELTKEELIEVVGSLGGEIRALRDDRDRWRRAGDAAKYLMDGESNG